MTGPCEAAGYSEAMQLPILLGAAGRFGRFGKPPDATICDGFLGCHCATKGIQGRPGN